MGNLNGSWTVKKMDRDGFFKFTHHCGFEFYMSPLLKLNDIDLPHNCTNTPNYSILATSYHTFLIRCNSCYGILRDTTSLTNGDMDIILEAHVCDHLTEART